MGKYVLTCIECPMGCQIEIATENGAVVSVIGNSGPRGKLYAENEVVCPKRVVTSTVKTDCCVMLPVKTDKPVRKSDMFVVMSAINGFTAKTPVKIGNILIKNIVDDANLVATSDIL